MSVPKKKPWVPTQSPEPRWAPHDGDYYKEPNPFPVPLQPLMPAPSSPLEWWWNPFHEEYVPVIPGLKWNERYASVGVTDIVDYPVASILGMGPEGATQISGKGGRTALSTGSGGGK